MKHMLKPASCMLEAITRSIGRVSSAAVTKRAARTTPRKKKKNALRLTPPAPTSQCRPSKRCASAFVAGDLHDIYAFGALVLSAYSPHVPTVVTS